MRRLGLTLVVLVVVAACGGPGATASLTDSLAETPAVIAPGAGADDVAALAAEACADTTYAYCIESVTMAADILAGSLVAICEYSDGAGDVVLLDNEDEAEAECSGDGALSPSKVVKVLQLP